MNIKAVFFDIDGTFYDHTTNRVLPDVYKRQHYSTVLSFPMLTDKAALQLLHSAFHIGCCIDVYKRQISALCEVY